MKGFADYHHDQLDEGLVRSGAVSMYASRGRTHGDKAVQHFRSAKQELLKLKRQEELDQKINIMADVLSSTLDGLIELRQQIGSISAQVTSSTILDKNRH
jgi:predicted Zn-dependent peptidase